MIELTNEQVNSLLYSVLLNRIRDCVEDDLCCYGESDEEVEYIKTSKKELIQTLYDNQIISYSDMRSLLHDTEIIIRETVKDFRAETERGE